MDSRKQKQVAIVTGSNTGIGRETALSLAKDGMKLFMACRSADRGQEAASYIREACPSADVDVLLLDLESLESVRKCASDFKARNLPLKLLINNAGFCHRTPWYTADGVGGNAQVNHLGHYLLTRLLEDSLVAGAPSRVVNVISAMSRTVKITDPVKFLRDFKFGSYSHAKFASILFTFELQRRWQGKGIQACAVDPGLVSSDIWRTTILDKPPLSWGLKMVCAPTWDGAIPTYHAATTPWETDHDKTPFRLFARGVFAWWGITNLYSFLTQRVILAMCDWPVRSLSKGLLFSQVVQVRANPQAYDEDLASTLWSLSAEAAGVSD